MKIFFDESGKKDNPPMLMGAVSIPSSVYDIDKIQEINKRLQSGEINFHFTKYNGNNSSKRDILELINSFKNLFISMRFNVLYYDKYGTQEERFKKMVYSKFPERLFYGLLRGKGELFKINVEIFMENATEYNDFPKLFKDQLNVQATYRNENYEVKECKLVPKNNEIGVEFTDLLLGIIRIIISTPKSSNSYRAKVSLVNKIISIPEVYKFLSSIKYFEWNNKASLKEVNFKDYVDFYIARNIVDIDTSNLY